MIDQQHAADGQQLVDPAQQCPALVGAGVRHRTAQADHRVVARDRQRTQDVPGHLLDPDPGAEGRQVGPSALDHLGAAVGGIDLVTARTEVGGVESGAAGDVEQRPARRAAGDQPVQEVALDLAPPLPVHQFVPAGGEALPVLVDRQLGRHAALRASCRALKESCISCARCQAAAGSIGSWLTLKCRSRIASLSGRMVAVPVLGSMCCDPVGVLAPLVELDGLGFGQAVGQAQLEAVPAGQHRIPAGQAARSGRVHQGRPVAPAALAAPTAPRRRSATARRCRRCAGRTSTPRAGSVRAGGSGRRSGRRAGSPARPANRPRRRPAAADGCSSAGPPAGPAVRRPARPAPAPPTRSGPVPRWPRCRRRSSGPPPAASAPGRRRRGTRS